jgi:hypothetical protein
MDYNGRHLLTGHFEHAVDDGGGVRNESRGLLGDSDVHGNVDCIRYDIERQFESLPECV